MAAQADVIRIYAPAKINLFLHVGEKRPDGFHTLESLVVFASTGDVLSFAASDRLSLAIEGRFAKGLEGEGDNLVLKAARVLAAHVGREPAANITLQKNLPIASGIGGGSADAAATLRGLAELWGLDMREQELGALAERLGSDVPVCVTSGSAWMEGRGERLKPVSLPDGIQAVLVNPGVAVPTAKVFGALQTRSGVGHARPSGWPNHEAILSYLKATRNDLEAPARVLAPIIGNVLDALSKCEGVELVRMSGSGATCFGLFRTEPEANAATALLQSQYAAWWVIATTLGARG